MKTETTSGPVEQQVSIQELDPTLDEYRQYVREELEDILYVLQLTIAAGMYRQEAVELIKQEVAKL